MITMGSYIPASTQSRPSETATSTLNGDPVNRPSYYTRGNIEVLDFIEDQGLGFHAGGAVKYICRAGHKPGNPAGQDIAKAITLLQRYKKLLEKTP